MLSSAPPPIHLTPATRDRSVAADWFRRFEGAGLDGVMAKPTSGTYEPDKRVMLKVKHERDCDCVVAGFRWHKKGDATRSAHCCSGSSTMPARCSTSASARVSPKKRAGTRRIPRALSRDALADHPWKAWADHGNAGDEAGQRMPGGQSRWSQGKDLSWEPLRPELVVEVAYDHMQGSRFRHIAQFRRWRTDKEAGRLHLCPARSGSAAGTGRDFRTAVAERAAAILSICCFFLRDCRHSRVGSSSGSGVSCGGRSASGT